MSENWEAFYHNDRHWVVHTDTALIADCFNSPDSEKNAKLIAVAPKMYELLNEAFHALENVTYGEALRYEIDACLCHVEGCPVPEDEEEREKVNNSDGEAILHTLDYNPEGDRMERMKNAAPELYNMLRYMLGYVREWEAISTGRIYKAKVQKDIRNAEALLRRIDGKDDKHE